MKSQELMSRWASYILRSQMDIRIKYGLEKKFKEKFAMQQTNGTGSPKKEFTASVRLELKTPRDNMNRSKSVI